MRIAEVGPQSCAFVVATVFHVQVLLTVRHAHPLIRVVCLTSVLLLGLCFCLESPASKDDCGFVNSAAWQCCRQRRYIFELSARLSETFNCFRFGRRLRRRWWLRGYVEVFALQFWNVDLRISLRSWPNKNWRLPLIFGSHSMLCVLNE